MNFIYKDPNGSKLEIGEPAPKVEYGTTGNVRFAGQPGSGVTVKLYANGKEVIIPKCTKCGTHKNQIIGKECFVWMCMMCGDQ